MLPSLLLALVSTQGGDTPPNVVHVVVDELGYYELSCMGHPYLETPNADALAAGGLRFTQMLAGSSVCAPTRACLLTGKHSGHTSVRTNGGGTPLREGEVTIGTILKERGYATGGFGKWGCGGRGSTGVPERHGFDVFLGYYDQVHAHTYYPAYLIQNSAEVPLAGNHGGREGETWSHAVIFDAALDFVREHRREPFYCYLPITPPHGLFDIPDSDPSWQRYADRDGPPDAKRYAAMVNRVDRDLGRLVALLEELGLRENTLLLFTGDNGGMDYFRSDDHPRGFHAPNVDPRTGTQWRGQKGELYEGGLRVPAIASWPGHVAPGTVTDHLCAFWDVMPTLAELCGARTPPDSDGLSFVPTLLGAEAAGRAQEEAEFLYWEIDGQTAVRRGHWKAVRPGPKEDWELYDLRTDPSESHDLAASESERLAQLRADAEAAHEPCVEGTFADRTLHEKDRAAKFDDRLPKAEPPKVQDLPREGLLDHHRIQVLRVSSESEFNGKLASCAIDGDPRTIWHSRWQGDVAEPPHELVLDLGAPATVLGLRYLARQDSGFNGTIARCDYTLSDDPELFPSESAPARFQKVRTAQESLSAQPQHGRYLRLRIFEEVQGGPWASIAELGVVGSYDSP